MELANILAFMLVASLLVISPGPNGVLIAKTVPVSGRAAGFANVWGFMAAFYVHGTLSVFGISIILVQSAQAFFVFKMLGAVYLIWVGVKALLDAWRAKPVTESKLPDDKRKTSTLGGAFLEGFITNVLNPKVSMFYLAAFPQFLSVGEDPLGAYMLVTSHAVLNLAWFSAMVVLVSRVKSVTTSAKFTKWLKSVTGAVFIGFGAKLALLKRVEAA